jgi:heme/copper-type cytochrome/quinol oxidase subunit 4
MFKMFGEISEKALGMLLSFFLTFIAFVVTLGAGALFKGEA